MPILKIKIAVCAAWTLCIVGLLACQPFAPASGQTKEIKNPAVAAGFVLDSKPESALIERFDAAVQQRFLTQPNFGIRRIVPVNPPNPHLEKFVPINDEEKTSVSDFEKDGWQVSLYLFGRRAIPKIVNGKEQAKFDINYRLNKPLPVTAELKERDLPEPEKLLERVKTAFVDFQTLDSPNENEYEFGIGQWSYVAKPVRAANESCLRCHADYVITEKSGDDQYKFRKRAVGDANGVLVYGFRKK